MTGSRSEIEINSDRKIKNVSGSRRSNREGLARGMRKLLKGMNTFVTLIVVMLHKCISMSKCIKLCSLNRCSSSYVNYTSKEADTININIYNI